LNLDLDLIEITKERAEESGSEDQWLRHLFDCLRYRRVFELIQFGKMEKFVENLSKLRKIKIYIVREFQLDNTISLSIDTDLVYIWPDLSKEQK
jgi:hypothetical protein